MGFSFFNLCEGKVKNTCGLARKEFGRTRERNLADDCRLDLGKHTGGSYGRFKEQMGDHCFPYLYLF